MVPATRVWIYVLSVAALLVPAGGIAYLGAVSYRDDRGAVRALQERQQQTAQAVAARIGTALEEALDEVDRATTIDASTTIGAPLGKHWFWIDADQRLRVPRASPASVELGSGLDRVVGCASPRLEDCVRELSTRQARIGKLHAALRAEVNGNAAEARRLYTALAAFDDTGPAALIGLARAHRALGDPERAGHALAELERRFAERTIESMPVRLVVATLRAEAAGPEAVLAVAEDVLGGRYALDSIFRVGVLSRLRERLDRSARSLTPEQARRRAELDENVAALRNEARAAAGLLDDVAEVARTAAASSRGRAAFREPARTLVYRRRPDGGVIGIAVDAPMLEAAAAWTPEDAVARGARPLVLPAGASPRPELRTISQVPLGTALPHLSLAIVNPKADPDPLDEVIRKRSRRHVIYTSTLALALCLGILATIRAAVRARELAQLKSDFVSTVSHELKTPLTSIRMFAEMLEQGVAQGDPAKMARYQGVIVQESHRLGLLIANLLDYAQIERGTRRYIPSRHPIAQVTRHAIATFEILRDSETGGRNPVEIEVSPEAMRADVEVDRDVIVQAVLNLVTNAAKYGGVDKPIEVSVGADAATAWIRVRDHGPGIPAAEQARIFREFYRTPEAYRSNIEGTGLGLALVKRHVEALGGTVDVASVVGEGATFTIRLPRVQEVA